MPAAVPQHVIVIGAGMAGLAAAEAVLGSARPSVRVTILEPAGRPGGVLATVREGGWLVERSADCFLAARPEAVDLATRVGLGDELVGVATAVRRALIWHGRRAIPAPTGFRLLAPGSVAGILATPLLSPAGRARLLCERFIRARRDTPDESLESFAVRRLGREAFERLVQPLASGIWTADPARLSMAAACPEFLAMERECGSLWAGERRRIARGRPGEGTEPGAAGARYGQFLTVASGMDTLPSRLAERLRGRGAEFVAAAATAMARRPGGGWTVSVRPAHGGGESALSGDSVVVAAPAPVAARLLADVDPSLAADLAGIDYAGSAVVSFGVARADVEHPLDAAGLVVPRAAGRRILAVSFSSSKFPGRAPSGCALIRVFVGGALDPAALDLDDSALETLAFEEASAVLGIRGRTLVARVDRWNSAMPQYHLGHLDRVVRIERAAAALPGLALAGAAYRGVGIPQVIASGRAAADRVLAAP